MLGCLFPNNFPLRCLLFFFLFSVFFSLFLSLCLLGTGFTATMSPILLCSPDSQPHLFLFYLLFFFSCSLVTTCFLFLFFLLSPEPSGKIVKTCKRTSCAGTCSCRILRGTGGALHVFTIFPDGAGRHADCAISPAITRNDTQTVPRQCRWNRCLHLPWNGNGSGLSQYPCCRPTWQYPSRSDCSTPTSAS